MVVSCLRLIGLLPPNEDLMPSVTQKHSGENDRRVPVVEFLHHAHEPAKKGKEFIEGMGNVNKGVHVFAGKKAFRIYNLATDEVGLNKMGNLRGVVKSPGMRTLFKISSEVGERLEILAFLAAFAENVTESHAEFDKILASNESHARKAVHLARLADRIANRTVVGTFTAGVTTIYDALRGWCLIGTMAGGKIGDASAQCVKVLQDADFLVKTTGSSLADSAANNNVILNTIEITLH